MYKAAESFPEGSIFMAIVNPGADLRGSRFVETEEPKFYFIGADPTLFDHAVAAWGAARAYLVPVHRNDDTFGTNTFSPIILQLLHGATTDQLKSLLGQELDVENYPFKLDAAKHKGIVSENMSEGYVCAIDRWGNLQTNIPYKGEFFVRYKEYDITVNVQIQRPGIGQENIQVVLAGFVFGQSYSDGEKRPGVLIQQDGLIQVAIFLDSAKAFIERSARQQLAVSDPELVASGAAIAIKITDGMVRITPR